jgi:hypothetical protein
MGAEQIKMRRWLSSHFTPYILTFASYNAKKKLASNNLTPAEFLRPFGEVGDCGSYTMRTAEKNEFYKLSTNFRLNFVDIEDMKPKSEAENSKVL